MDSVEKMPVRLKVASILRLAILSGEFADGEALSLTDTADRLKVSRTPVREAFQLLESEGLIELRMNREAIVHKIDAAFVRDHFDMRIMLESEAIARATRNGMDLAPLLALQRAVPLGDPVAVSLMYDAYNHDFHHLLWEGAGSKKLYAFLDSLWNGPSYSRTFGGNVNHELSIQEHGEMLALMQQGDSEGARKKMQQHMERSMDIILASLPKK